MNFRVRIIDQLLADDMKFNETIYVLAKYDLTIQQYFEEKKSKNENKKKFRNKQ